MYWVAPGAGFLVIGKSTLTCPLRLPRLLPVSIGTDAMTAKPFTGQQFERSRHRPSMRNCARAGGALGECPEPRTYRY